MTTFGKVKIGEEFTDPKLPERTYTKLDDQYAHTDGKGVIFFKDDEVDVAWGMLAVEGGDEAWNNSDGHGA